MGEETTSSIESVLNAMPDYICKDGEKYHLFIAKGTKIEGYWTVGYSNCEAELSKPITEMYLEAALMMLVEDLLEEYRTQFQNHWNKKHEERRS